MLGRIHDVLKTDIPPSGFLRVTFPAPNNYWRCCVMHAPCAFRCPLSSKISHPPHFGPSTVLSFVPVIKVWLGFSTPCLHGAVSVCLRGRVGVCPIKTHRTRFTCIRVPLAHQKRALRQQSRPLFVSASSKAAHTSALRFIAGSTRNTALSNLAIQTYPSARCWGTGVWRC